MVLATQRVGQCIYTLLHRIHKSTHNRWRCLPPGDKRDSFKSNLAYEMEIWDMRIHWNYSQSQLGLHTNILSRVSHTEGLL